MKRLTILVASILMAGAASAQTAEARGEELRIFWNGKKILEVKDATFDQAGTVGVWTKADSVTYFDDLTISGN